LRKLIFSPCAIDRDSFTSVIDMLSYLSFLEKIYSTLYLIYLFFLINSRSFICNIALGLPVFYRHCSLNTFCYSPTMIFDTVEYYEQILSLSRDLEFSFLCWLPTFILLPALYPKAYPYCF
jgi:hypothetical protein